MGRDTSEPAHRVIWAKALQTSGSQKSLPPIVDLPPVPPALLSALKCLPLRRGCRLSSRARHKGLLVGLQPREVGSAEPPGDSRPCHFLCAPRSSAWLRAGGRGFGAGGGEGVPGSRRELSCGQGAPGTRGRPTRTASRRPAAAGLAAAGNVLAAWLLQGSKQSARLWGDMWSPAGVAPPAGLLYGRVLMEK